MGNRDRIYVLNNTDSYQETILLQIRRSLQNAALRS